MREIPKLFTAPMIQAIQAKTKWQTRRLDGLDEINANPDDWQYQGRSLMSGNYVFVRRGGVQVTIPVQTRPGDILCVRETWAAPVACDGTKPSQIHPSADIWYLADGQKPEGFGKTRPGIFLPKYFWRIKRPVTAEERMERVQDISEEDAKAEGLLYHDGYGTWHSGWRHSIGHGYVYPTAKMAFAVLWESVHGPGAWQRNAWVRVITFSDKQ